MSANKRQLTFPTKKMKCRTLSLFSLSIKKKKSEISLNFHSCLIIHRFVTPCSELKSLRSQKVLLWTDLSNQHERIPQDEDQIAAYFHSLTQSLTLLLLLMLTSARSPASMKIMTKPPVVRIAITTMHKRWTCHRIWATCQLGCHQQPFLASSNLPHKHQLRGAKQIHSRIMEQCSCHHRFQERRTRKRDTRFFQ